MELKLKYNSDDVDKIFKVMEREWNIAERDYRKKKEVKGEKVDYLKMVTALNRRKKLKTLAKLVLASTLSSGNILDKPAINRVVEKLERESLASSATLKRGVSAKHEL